MQILKSQPMSTVRAFYTDDFIIKVLLDMYLFNKYCPSYGITEYLYNIFESEDFISYEDKECDTEEFNRITTLNHNAMCGCVDDFEGTYLNLEKYFELTTGSAIAEDIENYYLDVIDIEILKSSDSVNVRIAIDN